MIEVIFGVDKNFRNSKKQELKSKYKGERIVLDDMTSTLSDLKQYLYPSLFSLSLPVVEASYLVEEYGTEVSIELIKMLASSPTVFILEERSIASPILKIFEKGGAIMHAKKESKSLEIKSNIFSVTNALTATNKKDRWLSYQNARKDHPAEALIGILYWKLRDLIDKSGGKKNEYQEIYRKLIIAHKSAWQKGFPLDMAIEKVILS